jgi:hypothetical protein
MVFLSGMWRRLVAHLLWEQGVESSNLSIPTDKIAVYQWFFDLEAQSSGPARAINVQ